MLCQECGKRPSTLHFTKIVNGEKTEFHICELCAREKGEMIPGASNGFSIHNLLSGLMDFGPAANTGLGMGTKTLRCEQCGLTYTQFGKSGKFGCSSCYLNFSERLDPLLKRVHGNIGHAGKVPKRTGGLIKHKREIESLKMTLLQHIDQEEFEQAAEVRDQIRELENRLVE